MKTKAGKKYEITDFEKLTEQELVEAFIFPSDAPKTATEKKEDEAFWTERRRQFKNRTPQQKIYDSLYQLKFKIEDYTNSNQYNEVLNFGYFLKEYINRLEKQDKRFADEVDVKPTVLSQYLNNHRKPTKEFIIRLEIHSNGIISAVNWFKLLQKSKEHEIKTNNVIRKEQSLHVKNRVEFAY